MKSRNARFVGRLIYMMRKERSMRQAELAAITGLKQPNLSRIENGLVMPRQSTLEKLARALQLEVEDLFDEKILISLEEKWGTGTYTRLMGSSAAEGQIAIPLHATTDGYKLDVGNNGIPSGPIEMTLQVPQVNGVGDCFALRVYGDAMESNNGGVSFKHSDIIVFSDRPSPRPGDFALIRTIEGFNFRKYYFEEESVRLVPLNKMYNEKKIPRHDVIKAWKLVYLIATFP